MNREQRTTKIRRLRRAAFSRVIEAALLDDNMGAGVQISGVSGSGKSNVAEWMAIRMLQRGLPIMYVDPHGTSAQKIRRMCLSLPRRIQQTILYIRFADPEHTVGINPLHVPDVGQDSYVFESQLRVRVEQTAQVIFSLFGEGSVGFGNCTLLRKWLVRWLLTLGRSRLTLADAMFLVDPRDPVYLRLLQLVPDGLARHQMESLAFLKPAELEAEIGSARNRITAVLDHPTCQVIFSQRDNVLDFRSIYEQDLSVIIDLDKGDVLTDDAQQLIGNLVLNQYLATVLSTPPSQRRRRMCFIDELPVFESSAPLLLTMCTEIRKFRTKFAFLHQGSARFPDRHANEFLNTITDMCRVHLFFRHAAADARFFGDQVSLATWGEKQIKHIQTVPQQFTVGHDLVTLTDVSEGDSDGITSGSSNATATGTQDGTSEQVTKTLTEAVSRAEYPSATSTTQQATANGQSYGNSQTRSDTQTNTTSDSWSKTATRSTTQKQQLVARTITRDIVTSIQFASPEEIDRDHAARIKQYATGEATLLIDGLATYIVEAPLAQDPLASTPQFAQRKLAEFQSRQWQRTEFISPTIATAERHRFIERLLAELAAAQPLLGSNRELLSQTDPSQNLPIHSHPQQIAPKADGPWSI